jgi:hypothetical protein
LAVKEEIMPLPPTRFRHGVAVFLVFATGLLLAQSGATPSQATAGVPQTGKTAKYDTMVGVISVKDHKVEFATKDGSTFRISNPEILESHKTRGVEITGTFDMKSQKVQIQKVSNIACGPRFCERKCKGKCGNGSDCDCQK